MREWSGFALDSTILHRTSLGSAALGFNFQVLKVELEVVPPLGYRYLPGRPLASSAAPVGMTSSSISNTGSDGGVDSACPSWLPGRNVGRLGPLSHVAEVLRPDLERCLLHPLLAQKTDGYPPNYAAMFESFTVGE